MSEGITGVDHVLVGVRDLEGARETYTRLGFTPTPRGSHIGWGTANYCIMFADDYVELLGIVDPAKFTNRLDEFLERREGLMGLAFATRDAEAAYAELEAAGVAPEPPKDLARNLELPERTVQPRFKLVHLPAAATPAVPAFLCQHLSPEIVRRPEWLAHANGAQAITAVTVIVDAPQTLGAAYARLLGAGPVTPTDDMLTVRAGRTALVFVTPAGFDDLYPEVDLDAGARQPLIAGMTLAVASVDATAKALDAGGVIYAREAQGALVVGPADACGVVLEFSQS
ncbi:MAG: VOC family protein [Alphaproteobacteria bacterium]